MKRWLINALLASAVISSALSVVYYRHHSRGTFVRLQQLESHRDALNVEWGRLQLEQATWAAATRIEHQARSELGLVAKQPEQVVVVVK